MNLLEELNEYLLESIPESSYPLEEIVPIQSQVNLPFFYPLGEGIYKNQSWKNEEHYPYLILCEDCGNEQQGNAILSKAANTKQTPINNKPNFHETMWASLEDFLGKDVMSDCFFSSAIMGLRTQDKSMESPSYAFEKNAESFLKANISFFFKQLEIIDPDVIVSMGPRVNYFLSLCFPIAFKKYIKEQGNYECSIDCTDGYINITVNGDNLRIVFLDLPQKKMVEPK